MKLKHIIAIVPFVLFSCNNGNLLNDEGSGESISNSPNFELQNKKSQEIIKQIDEKQHTLKTKLKKTKGKNADNLYLEYSKLLNSLIKELETNEYNSLSIYNKWENEIAPDSIQKKMELYDKLQIKIIENNDGSYNLKYRPGFYYDMFKYKASKDLREYLKLATLQRKKPIVVDGLINEDWSEISNRLIIWENFIKNNPNSAYKEDAKGKYLELIQLYLFGNKNERSYSIDTKKIEPLTEQEYMNFVKKYGKTTTGIITKNFLDFFYTNDKNFSSEEFHKKITEYTNQEIEKEMKKF
ncbi:hypothetical protein EG240_12200 [Paenimyroides tangerinum]|uniref:Lipoprotein n=1 Tax=Paenimyroides tangerinum TaxID=2488728 RepID=A0A3P3W5Q6_9FLAO|nr:hypothetical protein [Paenimyroides tangerinum]RRJ89316.1 hypothetical protein EG240_12200 [Paenimyroides tangerinum]